MSDSIIPPLQTSNPDGSLKTRPEMDRWLRQEMPKVHWLRIIAAKALGLPKKISFDMPEIILRHWILDHLVHSKLVHGDILGVNTTNYNDDAEIRQFTQRLVSMIQTGQAVQPHHAEGIDMNGYTPPPPPVMGPPGTPAPAPMSPPGVPSFTPQPGAPMPAYQPPGVPAASPYPPGPPQAPVAPQNFAPPQAPMQQPAPMGPPGYAPPPTGVPMSPQMSAPVPPPGVPTTPPPARRGRKPADAAPSVPPPAAPVPPPGVPAQQGFAPAGFSAPPVAPVMPQVSAPVAAASDNTEVLKAVAHVTSTLASDNAALSKKVDILSMAVTILARAIYQKAGSADITAFLTELGIPLPQ